MVMESIDLGEHDQVIENIHNDVFNGAIYREVDRVIFQPVQDVRSEIDDGEIDVTEDSNSASNFGTDINCNLPGIQSSIETPLNGILGLSTEKFEEKKLRAGFCHICKKQYANLSIHVMRIHDGTARKYSCSVCGKVYHTKMGLNYHSECHAKDKPYRCQQCGKAFHLESNVRFHMHNTHRNQKTLCPFCGKCLYSAFSLKRHLRLHTGKRPFKCETCGMSFAYRNVLRDHKLIHSGIKPFECEICRKEFRQRSALTQHIKYVHNGVKNLQCGKCDMKFSRPSYLRQHIIRSHNRNRQQFGPCPKCGKFYSSAHTLKRHFKSHSDSCYRCDICSRRFTSNSLLRKHTRVYGGRIPFMCAYCEKSFHSKQNAERHEKKTHVPIIGGLCTKTVEIEIIGEEITGLEGAGSGEHLNSNITRVEVLEDVTLELKNDSVGTQFPGNQPTGVSDALLDADPVTLVDMDHLSPTAACMESDTNSTTGNQEYSVGVEEEPPTDKMVEVTDCSMEPTTSFHLQAHFCMSLDGDLSHQYVLQSAAEGLGELSYATSAGIDPSLPNGDDRYTMPRNSHTVWVCDVCGKETADIQGHKKLFCGNSEALERCGICNEAVRSTRMKYHKKTHEERQFPCQLCDKKFIVKSALTNHMKTHNDEKPFKCDLCQKSFRIEETLKKHIRTHTGERPYPCRICGLRFGHLKVRSDHEKIHTGEKPHTCDICGKTFRQRSTLRSHWAVHTTDKNFECNVCGKKFSRKNDLQQHCKRHDKGRTKFKCEHCGNEYSEHYSLMKHLKWHDKFPCATCNRRFNSQEELAKHEKKFEGKNPFSCGICDKKYHSKNSLVRHMSDHTGREKHTYKCKLCGSIFRSESTLKEHVTKFSSEEMFQCEACGKKFHLEKQLTLHMSSCSKENL